MSQYNNNVGVQVPHVLLPKSGADFKKWAVVACDQYTSQPAYWERAQSFVDGEPSTLNLILPEAYLGKAGEEVRIQDVKATMQQYLKQGVLEELPQGFIFVERETEGKTRLGLVLALDLEEYDYNKGATTLIRATEGTIVDRIPPRLRIREGAPIELPHILVLIDDPKRTVIEPLAARTADMRKLYDTDLMENGGHIKGYLADDSALIQNVLDALAALTDADAFEQKYGAGHAPLLFAMGDGNHSFATAKTAWENIKKTLPAHQRDTHPARYALVEIENVHDDGIVFEPIHRVLFGLPPLDALEQLLALLQGSNGCAQMQLCANEAQLEQTMASAPASAHLLPFFHGGACGVFIVSDPSQQLAVGTLQSAIDALLACSKNGEVDYIHGKDVVLELSKKENALGFLLPAMKKSELFPTVVYDGALPRKTFSMGEANEKRYYMECRKII